MAGFVPMGTGRFYTLRSATPRLAACARIELEALAERRRSDGTCYWDCYFRRETPTLEDHVGFRLLKALETAR